MNVLSRFTRKTLRQNKTRTLVTIIGIVLSVALITAVTTSFSSLQAFLMDTVILTEGNWHGAVFDADAAQVQQIQADDAVKQVGVSQVLGYAKLDAFSNENKPYLYVAGVDENFTAMMPVNLTGGRLPQNATEIILPEHLRTNGEVSHQIGDVLHLELGERMLEGERLGQHNGLATGENGEIAEQFNPIGSRTYTVVGFYERPSFESMNAPGYTALTCADAATNAITDLYIQMNNPMNTIEYMEQFTQNGGECNCDLLRFMGASNEPSYNAVFYSLMWILIAIIMAASISLIYNAFSISVSERTRQFGLLSSVGATKRQLKRSVIYEALILGAIGIPLGVLVGIAGIGLTLKLTEGLFAVSFFATSKATFHLSVSVMSIVIAVVVGVVTILISAYWPAKRAVRRPAIESIRQNADIKINPKKIKTSKLTYRLFGFEGMLASKNFKRNKKKYRATVLSLFVSIVLFVTASSFCTYLQQSVGAVVQDCSYDLSYSYTQDQSEKISLENLYRELSDTANVTQSGYQISNSMEIEIPVDQISQDCIDFLQKASLGDWRNGQEKTLSTYAQLFFLDDKTYEAYLKEHGYDPAQYLDADNPQAVAVAYQKVFYSPEGKYYTFQILQAESKSIGLRTVKTIPGYQWVGTTEEYDNETGETVFRYEYQPDHGGEIRSLTADEATEVKPLKIGAVTDQKAFGTDSAYGQCLCLLYPYSAKDTILGQQNADSAPSTTMLFQSDNHKATYDAQVKILESHNFSEGRLNDITDLTETNRALVTIVNVFAYGFIILISLISATNVFNTISTNVNLRKKEFAILKSVGMEERGVGKMMRYECLLYGLKGLVFGIPVSILFTYFIYQSISNGLNTTFFLPVSSLVIAVVSVFLVVFASMIYARNKIKKENIIDVLKSESI